jgi:hypothetical protein
MADIDALQGRLILLRAEGARLQDQLENAEASSNDNNIRATQAAINRNRAERNQIVQQISSLRQPDRTTVNAPGYASPEADIVITIPQDEGPGVTGGYGFGDTTEPPGSGRVLEEVGEDDPIFPGGGAGIGVGAGNGNAQGAGINPFGAGIPAPTFPTPVITFVEEEDDPIVAPSPAEQNAVTTAVPADVTDDPTAPVDLDEQNTGLNLEGTEATSVNSLKNQLQKQPGVRQTQQPLADGDWRYRLQLAPGAGYFYNDPQNQLMRPLLKTQGVLFPYTPRVDISYMAEYTKYRPTHSNYKQYFYQGSEVGEINVTADFTAQDTAEADYLLAVITFLKAASKMFYGQDPQRGSPPPLLYFTGLGSMQFNRHPVVISQFNYNLPDNVNYIKSNAAQIDSQSNILQQRRSLNTATGPSWAGSTIRLLLNNLSQGAQARIPGPDTVRANNQEPTYVPTKLSINFQLLPVATRKQISQNFSLKRYADGNLLRGGYW